MKRWLPFAPLVVVALLGALFAGYALRRDPEVHPDALVGQPLPDIALPPLEGGDPRPLRRFEAPLLINLFASWCQPCVAENPELLRLKAAGVPIIGVAYKDEPANTRRFLLRWGQPFQTVLMDRTGEAGIEFGMSGVPETYLVDRQGRIVAKHTGPMERTDADRLMGQFKALR